MQRNGSQSGLRSNSFSNGQGRNNFRTALSAEKSLEKYTLLAKEAMSSGDKTLSENYLQHADHYIRIIEDKNKIRNQNKTDETDKSNEADKLNDNQKKIPDINSNSQTEENN